MTPKIRILNIHIHDITLADLLVQLDEGILVTPNVDHLITLQHDHEFYEAYKAAEWVICDSRVVQLLSRLTRHPIRETISGSSFFTAYCHHHRDDADCRVFLLGAKGDTAREAMRRINAATQSHIIVDALSPSMGFDGDDAECRDIAARVNASGATVMVVGVGAPKQEKFIMRWRHAMPGVKTWMALGATIDFEAGARRRAPRWVRHIGMEWFYRFLHEPRRLFKRYFVRDLPIFSLFARQMLGTYKNPWGGHADDTTVGKGS